MKGKVWLLPVAALVALIAAFPLAGGCGKTPSEKPEISVVNPSSGPKGTKITIIGAQLGNAQGDSVVHIGGKVAGATAWTDVEITATVPDGLSEDVQGVTVLTPSGESNELAFAVTGTAPPPDRKEGQIEHPTPASAMLDFMKKKGINTSGWTFNVVRQSNIDPNWKIDKADKTGAAAIYFLLKKVNGNWVVVDDGNAMTPQELQGDGAPSDLWVQVPTPPPPSEMQVISDYMKAKGIDLTGISISLVKQSGIDPAWELFQAVFPPDRDVLTNYIVLHKEGGRWVVKNYGTDVDDTPGMPEDLKS
jgi:hypothetical protein